MTSPYPRYLEKMAQAGMTPDAVQEQTLRQLAEIHQQLLNRNPRKGFFSRLIGKKRIEPVTGLYMWGGVGRGKTTLMDLFFDELPFNDKMRFHFHRMMYRVQNRLKDIQDEADPIKLVADEISEQTRVICFDEFFVSDIGDAMILGRLMEALFDRGVTLVATSNIPPDELYQGGLQRQRFLPAIDLIQQYTQVLRVDNDTDYRLRVLEQAEIYHSPLDAQANENLQNYFNQIAPDAGTQGQDIEILGRNLTTIRRADGIAWFSFGTLCDGPRSKDDYIELARTFSTVLLSNLPEMGVEQENQARRFIALVDEFYDRRVKLIISAEKPINEIYSGKKLSMEIQRTQSRLLEMQSHDYLAQAHLP